MTPSTFFIYLKPDYETVVFKEHTEDWRKADIVVSTVQTLAYNNKYKTVFKPTDFSLIIADESHRSISGNSRAVFEYFIGYKLGLTATPKDYLKNVDTDDLAANDPRAWERRQLLDTYRTFGCESGEPTFRYSLIDGVNDPDGPYLVNPTVVDARTDITTQLLADEGYAVLRSGDEQDEDEEEKLYATEKGIKLQLIEEKSVNSYDPCKVMWGLSTSLYAKATGVLWHPEAIQNDTAYIGISYAFSEEKRICIGCSQLFDSTGTGIRMVLRKINNPILLGRSNPYMREDDARSMMTELREQYYHSAPVNTLRRVVIHKTTPFIREEITGIMQAFSGIEVELVQIQDYCSWRGIRFGADPGKTAYGFPVKRGMAVKLDRDSFLLWTHGCVIHPELSGPHNYYKSSRGIPAPLLVRRFAGNASGDTLAKEILMLTKMNWNSGDSLYKTLPVTLDFAKVLARMSKQEEAIFDKAYDFRFFM